MYESEIMVAIFDWVRARALTDERYYLIYHIPNGGARTKHAGRQLKREGVKRGVWDIAIDVPAHGYHGAKVEVKREGGKLSDEQIEYGRAVGKLGYKCHLVFSANNFIKFMEWYFEEDRNKVN